MDTKENQVNSAGSGTDHPQVSCEKAQDLQKEKVSPVSSNTTESSGQLHGKSDIEDELETHADEGKGDWSAIYRKKDSRAGVGGGANDKVDDDEDDDELEIEENGHKEEGGDKEDGVKEDIDIGDVEYGEKDDRRSEDLDELIWQPENGLTDVEVDQFLTIARSIGTYARALNCSSTVCQSSLHMAVAAASKDITRFHAMTVLHKHDYDIAKAVKSLVNEGQPVFCQDEMEEWSGSEAKLFENGLDKHGHDFNAIRKNCLPWKSMKSIIDYYYTWRKTDRNVQRK